MLRRPTWVGQEPTRPLESLFFLFSVACTVMGAVPGGYVVVLYSVNSGGLTVQSRLCVHASGCSRTQVSVTGADACCFAVLFVVQGPMAASARAVWRGNRNIPCLRPPLAGAFCQPWFPFFLFLQGVWSPKLEGMLIWDSARSMFTPYLGGLSVAS